jgi:hypothetical protein
MIGDGLGVVAGRHGDDAASALGLVEALQLGGGTPLLEGAGRLHVLMLHEHGRAGELRQARGGHEGRSQDLALDRLRRALHILDGDGVFGHVVLRNSDYTPLHGPWRWIPESQQAAGPKDQKDDKGHVKCHVAYLDR